MPPPANPFASPRDDASVPTSDGRTPRSRLIRQVVQAVSYTHLAVMAAVIGAVLMDLVDSSWALIYLVVAAVIPAILSELDSRTIWVRNLRVKLFGDAQAYIDRSIHHWNAGQETATMSDIERAIELDSQYAPARQFQAQASLAFAGDEKDPAVAALVVDWADWAIENQHEPAMAHAYRGAAHLILDDQESAVRDATIAAGLQPTLSYALAVRAYGNAALHDYEACLRDTSVVIQRGENDSGVDSIHAQALYQCGRGEESIEFAKSRILRGDQTAEWKCWLGAVYSEVGDFRNANESFQSSIALNPNLVDNWLHLANLGFHTGDLAAAKVALQRARELDAAKPLMLQCEAILAHQEHRFDDAVDLNGKLLNISEEDTFRCVALTNRAYAWHALKDYRRASEDYAAALDCDTLASTRWRHVAWFLSTCPDAAYRDGDRAIDLMRQERERCQNVSTICFGIDAAAHAESGEFDRAVELQEIYEAKIQTDRAAASVSNLDVIIPSTAMDFYRKRKPLHCDLGLPSQK